MNSSHPQAEVNCLTRENKSLPRVLIFCAHPFNFLNGSGITIANLFKGWPGHKLACLYWIRQCAPDTTICSNNYWLDENEYVYPFPYSMIHQLNRKVKQQEHRHAPLASDNTSAGNLPARASRLLTLKQITLELGLDGGQHMKLSSPQLAWIDTFAADVCYAVINQPKEIAVIAAILRHRPVPLVIHFFDDWMASYRTGSSVSSMIQSYRIKRELRWINQTATIRMAIGEEMAKNFQQRYGAPFLPFQNCPEYDLFARKSRHDWHLFQEFHIVFTGAIYDTLNLQSLLLIAQAIETLPDSMPCSIHLDIYPTPELMTSLRPIFGAFRRTHLHQLLADDQAIAALYGQADALLLTFDFGEQTRAFSYSMPTKLPSYMLSGTPIFVFGPNTTAVAKFLSAHKAGYVVGETCKVQELQCHLTAFCLDVELRRRLALQAQEVARCELSAEIVRPRFQQIFRQLFAGSARG